MLCIYFNSVQMFCFFLFSSSSFPYIFFLVVPCFDFFLHLKEDRRHQHLGHYSPALRKIILSELVFSTYLTKRFCDFIKEVDSKCLSKRHFLVARYLVTILKTLVGANMLLTNMSMKMNYSRGIYHMLF